MISLQIICYNINFLTFRRKYKTIYLNKHDMQNKNIKNGIT